MRTEPNPFPRLLARGDLYVTEQAHAAIARIDDFAVVRAHTEFVPGCGQDAVHTTYDDEHGVRYVFTHLLKPVNRALLCLADETHMILGLLSDVIEGEPRST